MKKTILSGGWLILNLCSLRWHEPDQVMRVERVTLLSAGRTGSPFYG